jgi:hypothetical protein
MRDYAAILSEPVIRRMVAETCVILHGQAVRNVKVDTGNLRNTISWALNDTVEGGNQSSGASADSADFVDQPSGAGIGHVGSNSDHAAAQEYGRPDLNGYHFRPYLRPAIAQTQRDRDDNLFKIIHEEMTAKVGP